MPNRTTNVRLRAESILKASVLPEWLFADLRTDHAGELGAVYIYRGVLAGTQNQSIRAFAEKHLRTEEKHLAGIESMVPSQHRSSLLLIWRALGFFTGYVSAVMGPQTFYATIVAVETFVDQHYSEQIQRIKGISSLKHIQQRLEEFCLDEIEHRDEATDCLKSPVKFWIRLWCAIVTLGSRSAVAVSRIV